jgi:Ca2+/Na+ antiporter
MDAKGFLFFAVAILPILIPFIPVFYKLTDKGKRFPLSVTIWGWIMIALLLIFVTAVLLLYDYTEAEEDEHLKELIQEQKENYNKLDSSSRSIIEALAKYGLKYDTAQQKIERLVRDSANRTILVQNAPDPLITPLEAKLTKKTGFDIEYDLVFAITEAPAYKIHIAIDMIIENQTGFHYTGRNLTPLSKENYLPKDSYFSIPVAYAGANYYSDEHYLHVKGNYEKSDGKKLYIDAIYIYNVSKNRLGIPIEEMVVNLRKFINKKK